MRLTTPIKALLILFVLVALLLALAALLFVSEAAFSLFDRLQQAPAWVWALYAAALLALGGGSVWAIVQIVRSGRGGRPRRDRAAPTPVDPTRRMAEAAAAGADIGGAQRELDELARRRALGSVDLALLGTVSSGKSALVRALVPGAEPEVSVVGGSTRQVTHYSWGERGGLRLRLADVPGLQLADGADNPVALDEARRAHVVLFLTEGDLTRADWSALEALLRLQRPMVVVLNKVDRYSDADRDRIAARIRERLESAGGPAVRVVAAVAGGDETVTVEHADGRTEQRTRPRTPRLDALRTAIDELLRGDRDRLETLRDHSVFELVGERLERAEQRLREQRGGELVRDYTRKAVFGALASVGPGTDLVVQGYLGTRMVRELCELHGVAVRDVDIASFLDLSQGHLGGSLSVVLAVAGNGLKAFPGVGTLAGGLVHAVAYGLIFDALGRALARSLEAGEALQPQIAAEQFRENLSEDLATRARELAGLAIEARQRDDA